MTDDAPFTRSEYETALKVLEAIRDDFEHVSDFESKRINDAHYTVQVAAEALEDEGVWDHPQKESVTTRLTLREIAASTEAEKYERAGFDLTGTEWIEDGLALEWTAHADIATDGGKRPAEPATPDDVPDECEVPWCDQPIENFVEAFYPPEEFIEDADSEGRMVMCDQHHVAARILTYTRPEPPYVDVGLYKEVTYYSRALAAVAFDLEPTDKVTAPQNTGDGDAN